MKNTDVKFPQTKRNNGVGNAKRKQSIIVVGIQLIVVLNVNKIIGQYIGELVVEKKTIMLINLNFSYNIFCCIHF